MSDENNLAGDFSFIPGAVIYTDNNGNSLDERSVMHNHHTTKLRQQTTEDHEEKEPSSFKKLFSSFAASTTAHGVSNIAGASSLPRRVVWSAVTFGMYVMLLVMCVKLVVLYMDKPVVSRMEMSFEESLDFPAVTICNLNMLQQKKVHARTNIDEILKDFHKRRLQEPNPLPGLTNAINVTSSRFQKRIQTMEDDKKKWILSIARTPEEKKILLNVGIDSSSLESKLLAMTLKSVPEDDLVSLGHGLDEMLKYCRWSYFSCHKGSLKKLWRHFWHWKYGNCYVFNSGLMENGTKVPVMRADSAGPYNGLEMDIFINQKEYTRLTDEAGVRVVLTDQARMPFPLDEGFSVPTGFSTSVGIKKRYIKRVDPYLNDSCIDENREGHETHSNIYSEKYHVNYSCQACRMSCLATKEVEICNCSEPRFPINSSACFSPEQNGCIRRVKAKYAATGLDCVSKCPQPCLENVFRFTISSARWSKAFNAKIKKKYKLKDWGNAALASENFLRLQIFYEDLSVAKTINEEAYKIENLLADIGGQLGLWIGVSVMTVVEVMEFITNLLTYLWAKRKDNKE